MTFGERNGESGISGSASPSSVASWEGLAGSRLFPYSGSQFPFVYNRMRNSGALSLLGIWENASE